MIRSPEPCACPIKEVGPSMTDSCGNQFLLFMTILEAFVNGRCDLADPCNRVQSRQQLDDSYDFVVVGGGTAGSVVAGRLSENPQWKVLLIEAGGDEPIQSAVPSWITAYWSRNDTDWNYHTEPQEKACLLDEGKCSWPRAKMLGGCSVINGMMYMRGHSADYDGWAVNGATGWSWDEVFPYFLKSEDNKEIGRGVSVQYHNTGGPMPIRKFNDAPIFAHDVVSAAIEMGYPPTSDLNGETITGFSIAQTMSDKGSRYSTARAFLRPASKRENLHVLLNTHVSRVIIDPLLNKVTDVEYLKDGVVRTVGVKKEAILSAGTLNSPQILLLSGVGPRDTLDKFSIPTLRELPGVGHNLHNHVGVLLEFHLTKEPDTNMLSWSTAMDYMLKREGPMSSTGLSQLTGIVNSKYAAAGGRHPDLQFFFAGYSADCSAGEDVDPEKLAEIDKKRDVLVFPVALHPKSRGFVSIRSTDPEDPPVMQPNYFCDEHELDVLVDGIKIARKLANTTIMREKYGVAIAEGFGSACEGTWENPTDEFYKCLVKKHTAPENHQVGTCKMGPDTDPMAVVDMQLKVHGVKGLRVIDASIIPTVTSGNTAAPVIMIAERGAEFITTTYQRSKTDNRFGADDDDDGYHTGINTDRWDPEVFSSQTNKEPNQRWKPWEKHWDHPQWQTTDFQRQQDWHNKHKHSR